jgi:hypothetical protein
VCQFPESQGWDLEYRASRDGFREQDFQTKCEGVSNHLTIIKTTNGNIFGVFAEKAWPQAWKKLDPVEDSEAFIISLINIENKPFKAMVSSVHPNKYKYYTLYPSNGLSFGYDNYQRTFDISISSDSNANQNSSSNFGNAFKHQDYPAGSAKAQAILAGSQYFQTIEIEVFTKRKY